MLKNLNSKIRTIKQTMIDNLNSKFEPIDKALDDKLEKEYLSLLNERKKLQQMKINTLSNMYLRLYD